MALYFITQAERGYIADDHALIAELAKIDATPLPRPWRHGLDGITAADTLVIRAIWDYHLRPAEFLAWVDGVERLGCRLINSAKLIRWNHRKTYLSELAEQRIAVPETRFFSSAHEFLQSAPRLQHAEYVLKPLISASAYKTVRVAAAAVPLAAREFGDLEFMLQEFLPEIADGEWSLIFIGGAFTHAMKKVPTTGEFRSQRDFGAQQHPAAPPPAAIREGTRILDLLPEVPAYARVDFVMRRDTPFLIEVELIEPELFLRNEAAAAARLAKIIARA